MRLTALAIDKSNNAGDRARRQVLREKDVQPVEKAGNHDVFSTQCFDVGNLSGLFRSHAGTLPSLTNARALSKFGLRNSGTIHGDGNSRSLKLIFQRRREREQERLASSIHRLEWDG